MKQEKVTFTHGKVVNICIAYKINLWAYTQGADFVLGTSLFEAVKLTRNDDYVKKYSGYLIGFDARGSFSLSDGSWFSKNFIIIGADMSSSVPVVNKKKDILILRKQGLDDIKLTA